MIKEYGCFNLVHFPKKMVVCQERVPKFWVSVAIPRRTFNRFSTALDQTFKLKYEDLENILKDGVKYGRLQLTSNQKEEHFWDTR